MKLSLVICCALVMPAWGGWRSHHIPAIQLDHYSRPAGVSLIYEKDEPGSGSEGQKLVQVLRELEKESRVKTVRFMRPWTLTNAPEFQEELIQAFKQIAPEEWAAVEKSAGNMHNPSMKGVMPHLTEAFMRTTLAKQIAKDLAHFDLQITEFGQEKLSYSDEEGVRMIRGIFHVGVAHKDSSQPTGDSKPQ